MRNQLLSCLLPIIIIVTDTAQLSPEAWAIFRMAIYFIWGPLCTATLYSLLRRNIKQMTSSKSKVRGSEERRDDRIQHGTTIDKPSACRFAPRLAHNLNLFRDLLRSSQVIPTSTTTSE
jgi:hypothetical protein